MSESNFCTICGQRWDCHSWERCNEIAEQLENEGDADEGPEHVDPTEFGDRLQDGFQMMSDFDDV
jgi:hypothetical protein